MYEPTHLPRADGSAPQVSPVRPRGSTLTSMPLETTVFDSAASENRPPNRTRILVVDDDEWIREILCHVIARSHYEVETVGCAEEALDLLVDHDFALILCDMQMRGMSGLDLTRATAHLYPHIPVILITAHRDTDLMRAALREGAADFVTKPFNAEAVPMIIERNLERRALTRQWVEESRQSYMFSNVQVLAAAIDAKEPGTAEHSRRVARVARAIAGAMSLTEQDQELVDWAAQVHDVGKIATPDHILLKTGQLTDDEWRVIRRHPVEGQHIVGQVRDLCTVAGLVRSHHERIDGTGYPDRLSGEQIPLLARVIAVADAFEVMTADRVYRSRISEKEALRRLEAAAGTQFDSGVVRALLSLRPTERR